MKITYKIDTRPFLFSLILFLLSCGAVLADSLNSNSYGIQMSTINISGGNKTSSTYRLGDTIGQTVQGVFGTTGYKVRAGFQYVHPIVPFTFRISNLSIDFGSLVPNTHTTASNNLHVTTGSAFGYTVRTIQDHPLKMLNSTATIPDTACDSGTPCTISDANVWTSTTSYGFGYNIGGNDVDTADFVNGNYFRPFPSQGIDDPVVIMSHSGIATASSATVTYNVNIQGSQAAGTYENSIQFIAIPSF